MIESINPYSGQLIKTYQEHDKDAVNRIIASVHEDHLKWRTISFSKRADLLARIADLLTENRHIYGRQISEEMGKLFKSAEAEVKKCAWVCQYYARKGPEFLRDLPVETEAAKSYITCNPLGVVLAVMPWNFPFWQVFRFCAPALMAGNGLVLKHASNVSGSALLIEEILREAGGPENLFRTVLVGSSSVRDIIENPIVKAVSLTGSTEAGRSVASLCGKMLKKTVMELGGNDPYIIFSDADLEPTVDICFRSKMINGGQSCIAAKRFIVTKAISSEFIRMLKARMAAVKMGDPFDERTDLAPLARFDLRDELDQQVRKSIKTGAECLLGGYIPEGRGAFYPPTILSRVKPGMPAYNEELFGPVASIITVENEEEAVKTANDSCFGLGAAIFSADKERAEAIARNELEAGCCFVNGFVRSDPRLPFGGIKQSGYGRELSEAGIKEFINLKTVYVN